MIFLDPAHKNFTFNIVGMNLLFAEVKQNSSFVLYPVWNIWGPFNLICLQPNEQFEIVIANKADVFDFFFHDRYQHLLYRRNQYQQQFSGCVQNLKRRHKLVGSVSNH